MTVKGMRGGALELLTNPFDDEVLLECDPAFQRHAKDKGGVIRCAIEPGGRASRGAFFCDKPRFRGDDPKKQA